jgi:hypothetical protein
MASTQNIKDLIDSLLKTALGEAYDESLKALTESLINAESGTVNPYTIAISVLLAKLTQNVSTAGVYKNSVDTIDTSKFPDSLSKFIPLWQTLEESWSDRNDDSASFLLLARSGRSYTDDFMNSVRRTRCN